MGGYVYDFADFSARLLIELDGVVHDLIDEVAAADARKQEWAASQGFKLLRLRNSDVWGRPDWVGDEVRRARIAPHPLTPPHKGEGDESAAEGENS